MVYEKLSTVNKSLSYQVKPNCSNVNKRILISGIRLTYKIITLAHVAGLDPAGLAGSLAQTSDPAAFYQPACVNKSRTLATATL